MTRSNLQKFACQTKITCINYRKRQISRNKVMSGSIKKYNSVTKETLFMISIKFSKNNMRLVVRYAMN